MSDQIKLDDCPEILRDAIKDELAKESEYPEPTQIISCTACKSINEASTTYKVYIFFLNAFIVLTYISNPKYYDIGVMKDMVTIGEVREIIRAAPEYFK